MDSVNAATATTPTATNTAATSDSETDASLISSDFETFLRMLTTQLENQDPLNPLDSQDFAAQLAQFSSVEQQTKTNTLLEDMNAQLRASGLSDLSNWLGREARVSGDLPFNGSSVTVTPEYFPGASAAEMVISNAAGQEVARFALVPGQDQSFTWNGLDADGHAYSPGIYSFKVENKTADSDLPDSAVSAYLPVQEARTSATGTVLVLDGGLEVTPDSISAMRLPGEA